MHHENPEKFWELINQIGDTEKTFDSMYTKASMDFYKQRYIDEQIATKDKSFALLNSGLPVIIFFGVEANERNCSTQKICWYEAKATFWQLREMTKKEEMKLSEHLKKEVIKNGNIIEIRDHLDKNMINKGSIELSRAGIVKSEKINYTRKIDLTQNEEELRMQIRKRFKTHINWGTKNMELKLYAKHNISETIVEQFRDLHREEAGRETRSADSWRKQFEAVRSGQAFCIYGEIENELVSAGYFLIGNNHCYYGSSASKRSMFDKPLFHSVMWSAIIHAKRIGMKVFETGQQILYETEEDHCVSPKEHKISDFKAGFGGQNHAILDLKVVIKTK